MTTMDWHSFQNNTQKTQLFGDISTISPHHIMYAVMLSSRSNFFILKIVWKGHVFVVRRLAREYFLVSSSWKTLASHSPWPIYYRCKWPVELFRFNSKNNKRTTSRPWDFSFRSYFDWSRSWSLCKVHHLWNKYVLVKIGWCFYQAFLVQTHVSFDPSQWFLPMSATPQRLRYRQHNIYSPWFVVA